MKFKKYQSLLDHIQTTKSPKNFPAFNSVDNHMCSPPSTSLLIKPFLSNAEPGEMARDLIAEIGNLKMFHF
jgi:hypothetical protein